jgi:hypothetical protein
VRTASQIVFDASRLRSAPNDLPRSSWIAAAIAALALQLAIALLGLPPAGRPLVGDEAMYVGVAQAWASGDNAILEPLWPPGQPALLAAWLAITGNLQGFLLLQVGAHLLAAATLGRLAFKASGDPRVALLTAILFACDPQVAAFAQMFWPETLHLAAALLTFEQALCAPPGGRAAITLGAMAAFALLLKSALSPFLPLLLAAFVWRAAGSRLRLGALAVVTLLLLLAPVLTLNQRRHGFLGVADSTAFNLFLGLTDRSPRSLVDDQAGRVYNDYLASGAGFLERRRALVESIREHLAARGLGRALAAQLPRQYYRLFDHESYFSAMLPGGSLATSGQGFRDPPTPLATTLRWFGLGLYALVLASAPAGLAILWQQRRASALWALVWLGYLLALFVVLHVKVRYRVLLMPVLDLGAAYGLVYLASHLAGHLAGHGAAVSSSLPWTMRVLVGALGFGLLALAFGRGGFG